MMVWEAGAFIAIIDIVGHGQTPNKFAVHSLTTSCQVTCRVASMHAEAPKGHMKSRMVPFAEQKFAHP